MEGTNIFSFGSKNSLNNWIYNNQAYPLDLNFIAKICAETALGMHFLHSKKCVHRDLKSHNILISLKILRTLTISAGCEFQCEN
jgi:serine/threonine protein kinase